MFFYYYYHIITGLIFKTRKTYKDSAGKKENVGIVGRPQRHSLAIYWANMLTTRISILEVLG